MTDVCVVEQGVTCPCCHPGLKMTVRMGPSHFAIWVSVPSFSEDQRNRNSRYEIKGAISQSFYLAPSPLCLLSTSGESLLPLLLSHVSTQIFLLRKISLEKLYNPLCLCPQPGPSHLSLFFFERHWLGLQHQLQASSLKNARIYPAVCTFHKVALDRNMIPPPTSWRQSPAWFIPNPSLDSQLFLGGS